MKPRTIIALLALLLVGGAAAWKFFPHTLNHDECSDVYRHFADMRLPGVRVTYVQDKIINDTLRLPVTLLQAETDEGWYMVLPNLTQGSYTLSVKINSADKTCVVPEQYMQWLPGYSYTYIFKVTEEGGVEIGWVEYAMTPWTDMEVSKSVYNW